MRWPRWRDRRKAHCPALGALHESPWVSWRLLYSSAGLLMWVAATLRSWRSGVSIMMTDAKKDAIRIVNRTTVKEVGDRMEVEWQLSATPDLEWAEVFQLAVPSDRQGSSEWVRGGSPDVIGAAIRWFVPSEEVEDAEAEVQHRLNVANERTGSGRR